MDEAREMTILSFSLPFLASKKAVPFWCQEMAMSGLRFYSKKYFHYVDKDRYTVSEFSKKDLPSSKAASNTISRHMTMG